MNLIASFAAELVEKAQAEVPAAQKKFAQDPGGFRRWCAAQLQIFRGQLTVDAFLQWAEDNPSACKAAIDGEAQISVRELDRVLLEHGTEIEQAHQAAEAARRPVVPDNQRRPPSREQLLDPNFRASKENLFTTAAAVSGRRSRRSLRR
jgi:hypothetical protein